MSDERALHSDEVLHTLVLRARQETASRGAIDELDRLLRPRLLRYFSGTALSGEDPEDLVQKTLVAVFKNVGRIEDPRRFIGWLFAIARNVRNTALEESRRRGRVEVGGPAPVEPACAPEERWALEETDRRIEAMRAAIAKLPARQRQCLLLRLRDAMPYEEIALTLRLSANTVRNHLAQARETLRRELSGPAGRTGR